MNSYSISYENTFIAEAKRFDTDREALDYAHNKALEQDTKVIGISKNYGEKELIQ